MFAHVTDGVVDRKGYPPRLQLVDGEWLDLRPLDPAVLALAGWFPYEREDRPEDTATTTWDSVESFDGSTVTVGWVERDKTDGELLLAARVTSLEERVDAIEEIVLDRPDPDEGDTPVWSSPCPPNAVIRWPDENGDRHRNVSGAWLVATPDEYPIGYVNLDVGQVDEWAAGVAYTVGVQVTYQGKTYQCAQAHQSQAGWTPVAVPALWVLVG